MVAFGQILKKPILDIPKWGLINIHASLLPKYRGAAPIQWTILNDDSQTGLTVIRMDEGMDSGPILFQESFPILKDETAGQLYDRLAIGAGDLIIKSLNRMVENPVQEYPQEQTEATYAPKIDRHISLIDWKQEASKVSALIRGLDPRPGAYSTLEGKAIKLFSSRVVDEDRLDTVPGKVVKTVTGGLNVRTGRGVIEVGELQYSGKKRLKASDFLRGFALRDGTIMGQ